MSGINENSRHIRTQGYGSFVKETNQKRIDELYRTLHKINTEDFTKCKIIAQHEKEALSYIDAVRDFVGSPEKILGNGLTKHGEIAEHVEVEFQNAWSVMRGKQPTATFDGVGRTAPEDFIIDGVRVQSKYINGASNSLSHVIKHLETYKEIGFGIDGSYYVIPKDQYELIQSVLNGNTEQMSSKTVRAIQDKISKIEAETNHRFADVVKAGQVDYAEVQKGEIHQTLDRETDKLRIAGGEQEERVHRESDKKRRSAADNARPSWGEAAKVAGISAAIGGGFQLAGGIYQKCSAGKKLEDFTSDDWKELGIDAAKAGAEGAISGVAIYAMTNWANTPAPIAGAAVSFAFGTVDLIASCTEGKITSAEFAAGCKVLCIRSVMCALGAALGDKLIPIPILGSVIGAAIVGNITEELLGNGAYGAIADASSYVYGSSVALVQALHTLSENHRTVQQNTEMSARILERAGRSSHAILAELGGNS